MEKTPEIEKKWIKIYPIYFDKSVKLSEGRKVAMNYAVEDPNVRQIYDVCTNFYGLLEDGEENPTSASYVLTHLITIWMDGEGSANPSSCKAYYDVLPDGGFAIGGDGES